MRFIEYPDREMMMIDLANQLAGELSNYVTHHDSATFAVPGGTTPGPVFDTLSGADLHWDRIRVLLTDERWVPEEHERSNTRLIRERLLTNRAAMADYIPLYAETDTPEDAIDDLAARLEPELPLSVLLLGMGADGHIASIFPGADRLDEALSSKAPPLMAMRAPGAPEPRITLTAPVLTGAMSTHILITGAEKRETLERARHAKAHDLPVQAVLHDATVHWAE
ncbi:6-phosphogluconolactonase [Ovoidimarina sediminis]|uniref:6-phosphogluconolactonase n=1 Tax=Ovoidimarina sediminis TaxID=3079856 RepID=UPI0029075645|nr:6-phosphogluconolactonase [Rhodophyticola sp. MJ-SS7]MDU8945039.1 6-phosphogluconolactonase [Rhodophyticola sp. MJ-SS7]